MSDLEPCPACRRHVRTDETACPFCEAALGGAASRRLSTTRVARAVVFAGAALATAAAGCGGKQKQVPDREDTVVENQTTEEETPTPDAGPPVKPIDVDNSCCMPYGAPPRRDRLV
jgi:hypothetical protein